MDGDLCRASPRRGTLSWLPRGALTLITGRDLTTQIGIVSLAANLIFYAIQRRVATDPGVWPSAPRRAVSRRASGPVFNRDEVQVILDARDAIIYT
jgi:hypothetical protein